MLERLFEMQRALNDRIFDKHTLGVVSRDFDGALDPNAHSAAGGMSSETRQKWVLNYLRALVHEAIEAEDACAWKWWTRDRLDEQALKVEVVDLWHLLISLTIAAGMSPQDLLAVYEQKWRVNQARQDRGDYGRGTKAASDEECRAITT
ncbi:dUTP diphosphatase [bacterium]|nr:dUTP diphosphatase [bacterium]